MEFSSLSLALANFSWVWPARVVGKEHFGGGRRRLGKAHERRQERENDERNTWGKCEKKPYYFNTS